jgi:hypothetical protein
MELCGEALRKNNSGMIKIKSLFLREGIFFCSFRVCKSGFHDLLWVEGNLFPCSNYQDGAPSLLLPWLFCVSRSCGQDPGVLKLDAVTKDYAVHGPS